MSNPVDCGGPPIGDERGLKILEALVADPKVAALIVPVAGAVDMFSEGLSRDCAIVAKTTDKPIFMVWGAPPGTDDHYYYKMLDGGLPVFRTFGNCVDAMKAYFDYWAFVRRYRSPFTDAPTAPLPAAKKAKRILDAAPGSTQARPARDRRPRRGPECARGAKRCRSTRRRRSSRPTASSRHATCCATARPKRCGPRSSSGTPW